MRTVFLALIAWAAAGAAHAQLIRPTWVVLGDSIPAYTADGQPEQTAVHLVEQERDIAMRNLSSPSAAMGGPPAFGYNGTLTTDMLDHICGYWSACNGVIIQAGSNDWGMSSVSWQNVVDSMNRVINWAASRGKKVIVLDLIWRTQYETGSNHMGQTFATFRVGRALVCGSQPSVCYFATRPSQFNVLTPSLFAASEQASGQHVHPNVAGQRVYADWIKAAGASTGWF